MHWLQIDERLRRLYNAVSTAHSETVSTITSTKADKEAMLLMEELTLELEKGIIICMKQH